MSWFIEEIPLPLPKSPKLTVDHVFKYFQGNFSSGKGQENVNKVTTLKYCTTLRLLSNTTTQYNDSGVTVTPYKLIRLLLANFKCPGGRLYSLGSKNLKLQAAPCSIICLWALPTRTSAGQDLNVAHAIPHHLRFFAITMFCFTGCTVNYIFGPLCTILNL